MNELRTLLEEFWICRDADKEEYYRVRRDVPNFQKFVREQMGWKLIAGVLCYLCSFLLWLYIVSRTQLTFALPLSVGIVNVLVFLGSAKFLGEQITPLKIAGLAVIVIGLFLLSAGQKGS